MPAHVPPSDDERTLLLAYLANQRYAVRLAGYGLTDEQAGLTPTASALSIGGIVKHLTLVERNWRATVDQRDEPADVDAYAAAFRFGPSESLDAALDVYAAGAAETDALLRGFDDLNHPVPVPKGVPWFPRDVEAWSVRWVLVHLIRETARHGGHVDIIRECIDGATAMPLMAAAEGWEPTPWLQAWQPAAGRELSQ